MMRGVSPIVSYVLVIAIVLTSTLIAYTWALPLTEQLGEKGKVNSYKNQMIGLDYAIRASAHGDINFKNEYEIYMQDASILLDDDNDVVYLKFRQSAIVLGEPSISGYAYCTRPSNVTGDQSGQFLTDPLTNLNLYRESDSTRVFQGSTGQNGLAEFAICYYDIDLVWKGSCIRGTSSSTSLITIEKTGVNATTLKPIVAIDIC